MGMTLTKISPNIELENSLIVAFEKLQYFLRPMIWPVIIDQSLVIDLYNTGSVLYNYLRDQSSVSRYIEKVGVAKTFLTR